VVDFKLNILEIEPSKDPNHTNKIQITENLGICMKYPTFEMIEKYENANENEIISKIIADCVDYIYDKEQIYWAKDSTREELEEFIDNLQQKNLEKIKQFFDTMPEIKKNIHFKCPKCSYEEDITLKGMQSFFV
jgi:Ribonuclease G/E